MPNDRIAVFSTSNSGRLVRDTCALLSIDPGSARVGRFKDGEIDVRIESDVRDADVFIVGSTNPPAENLLEMLFLARAARGSSARRITLVPTYLGYNRQDRKDRPRVAISAKVVADVLATSGADRVLLFDLHSAPTAGYFDPHMVVDHLLGASIAVEYLQSRIKSPFVVASPDAGGVARAREYATLLGLTDIAMFLKERSAPGAIKSVSIVGSVKGKRVLFVDDMVDSAGTLVEEAHAAKEAGASKVYAFATHALFSGDALERIAKSALDELVVTDTITHAGKTLPANVTVLPIAPLLAKAIRRIHDGSSLTELFRKPPGNGNGS